MTLAMYIGLAVFNLGLIVVANIYIPKRLCSLFGIGKAKYHILAFTLVTILGIWGIMSAARVSNVLVLNLFRVSIVWLGLAFYLFLFLLIYELVRLVVGINKKQAGWVVIILSVIFVAYGTWNARDYKVYDVEIPVKGLVEEVTIFHAPDIHLGPFRGKKALQRIVEDINRLSPDFVLLNGDLVDGMDGLTPDTLSLLNQIRHSVYFTGGNHDEYVNLEQLEKLLIENGVAVLKNDVIRRNGIQLVGLNYMNADDQVYDAHASSRTETIKSVLPGLAIDSELPTVVVHHSPVGIEYMNQVGAVLVLSGHTHAGQFFPATLIALIQFPYLKGKYHYKDTTVYVSQGIGTFGPPMRVGTEGEATLVKLVPSQ